VFLNLLGMCLRHHFGTYGNHATDQGNAAARLAASLPT
jgi:hypothetical protein